MLKVGDRVILKESSKWTTSKTNPKQGSEFACEGTIIESEGLDVTISYIVRWDNNTRNTLYTIEDLQLVNTDLSINHFKLPPLFVFHAFNRPYIKER